MASERSQRLISSILQITSHELSILLIAVVCGVTSLFVQANTPQTDEVATQPKRHTADYTMDGTSAIALDETGTTEYRFTGVHMDHCEDDPTYNVTHPALRVYALDRPQVTVRTDLGKMNSDGAAVDLYNNAKAIRARDSDARQGLLMMADPTHFQMLFNDDTVRADKLVELHRGSSIMNINGLTPNNVTRQV